VLAFGYDSSPSSFCGSGCADTIQKHAHTLVASLQAYRSIEGCDYRPIIFICHGLGGVLVKKALAYSSSRTSSQVQHLYTIFVSTYAILFFGTPYDCVNSASWLALDTAPRSGSSADKSGSSDESRRVSLEDGSTTLQIITEQFAPLMKKFRIYFFWEELPTSIKRDAPTKLNSRFKISIPLTINLSHFSISTLNNTLIVKHNHNTRMVFEILMDINQCCI
jgi:hypothetical protein